MKAEGRARLMRPVLGITDQSDVEPLAQKCLPPGVARAREGLEEFG